jgi:uncharacterized protein (TIGR03000 family)
MRNSSLVALVGLTLFTVGRAAGQEPARPVHLTFVVPAEAQVWVEGAATTMRGPVREFVSPAIPSGPSYIYTVRVRWQRDGQAVDEKRDLTVKAGDFVELNYTGQTGGYTSTPGIAYGRRSYSYSPPSQPTPRFFPSQAWLDANRIGYYSRQTGILSYYGATPGWGTVDTTGLR